MKVLHQLVDHLCHLLLQLCEIEINHNFQNERERERNRSYLILRNCSMSVVNPPHTRTVPMTITRVVVKMSCLA